MNAKTFQGGLGLAVAVVLATVLEDFAGYKPPMETVGALAYILGYVAKQAGLKVED